MLVEIFCFAHFTSKHFYYQCPLFDNTKIPPLFSISLGKIVRHQTSSLKNDTLDALYDEMKQTLNALWTHPEHTLSILLKHAEHTLNIP